MRIDLGGGRRIERPPEPLRGGRGTALRRRRRTRRRTPTPEPTPTPTLPSNEFTIGKAKLNKDKGTAKLPVEVPGPGTLELAGKLVKGKQATAGAAGEVERWR